MKDIEASGGLATLLVQGMDVLTTAVTELAKSAGQLRAQAVIDQELLARRIRYARILIGLLVFLGLAIIFGGVQLVYSGDQRAEQLRIVRINQECQVQVRFSSATTAEQAVAVYRHCVAASK